MLHNSKVFSLLLLFFHLYNKSYSSMKIRTTNRNNISHIIELFQDDIKHMIFVLLGQYP